MSTHKKPFIIVVAANNPYDEVQKHAIGLCKQHKILGYDSILIVGKNQGIDAAIAHHVIALPSLAYKTGPFAVLKNIKGIAQLTRLLRAIKKEHGRCIVHTIGPHAGIIGRLAGFFAGITHRIHTIYGFAFHKKQNGLALLCASLLEMVCALLTSRFICSSENDVKIGCKKLPGFNNKYIVIRPFIETIEIIRPAFQAKPFPVVHEHFVFGTSTQLSTHTNIMDLLKAFEYAYQHNQHMRLEIVGEGPLHSIIQQWIMQHHLNNVITLHGWHANITPFIKQWHAYISVLTHVGLPLSCIEARYARLPIICYDTGGIRDIVFHGVNGFVHTENDWLSLAKSMLSISIDDLLHITLQRYPDNFADFEITNNHKKLQNIYSSL